MKTLKELIRKKGTYEHCAKILNWSLSSLINLSNNKNTDIKCSRLVELSIFLKVSESDLLKILGHKK